MARREPTLKRDAVAAKPDAPTDVTASVDETSPESAQPAIENLGDLGRYQLLFRLAKGGMGTIHVGRLRSAHRFDRFVAIKRLSVPSASEEDVRAFVAEARISAMINHPNVVQTLDVGEHKGMPFLVLPLVEGVSLDRLLRRIERRGMHLDPHVAAFVVAQAARGLQAAHELCSVEGEPYGLVHRDVSPENVLLSFDGRVYVADFGVARFADPDHRTQSGVVKGKFGYMSPEQTEAGKLDARSDVFSLGIVLHECLTGRPLFQGRSVADTIRRIWSLDPPDPREGRDDVPPGIVPIVRRCLQREAELRYASAGEVADDLRELSRSAGVAIDEADVARVLREHFPQHREKLRERIREAIRAADEGRLTDKVIDEDLGDDSVAAGEIARSATELTGSITTGPPLETRRGSIAWFALAGVVAVALGAWLLRDPEPPAEPSAPQSIPEPSRSEEPGATASAPHASASVAASAPVVSSSPRTYPRTPVRPAKPSPSAKSHKGVPFKSVD